MENNNHSSLEQKIMGEIATGRIKLRSRYIFLAESVGLRGVFSLTVLLAIVLVMLVFFTLRASDSLIYLSFGSDGVLAFLESFPYMLVVGVILVLLGAGYLLRQFDVSYKKSFGYMALVLVGVVLAGGVVLGYTSIPELINETVQTSPTTGHFLTPLLHHDETNRVRGVAGQITDIQGTHITVQTPQNERVVDVGSIEITSDTTLEPGSYVVVIGKPSGTMFVARQIRVPSEGSMPLTRRRIEKRLPEEAVRMMHQKKEERKREKCLAVCEQVSDRHDTCVTECVETTLRGGRERKERGDSREWERREEDESDPSLKGGPDTLIPVQIEARVRGSESEIIRIPSL